MKQWQLDAAREELLLEIQTLLVGIEDITDTGELLRITKELSVNLEHATKNGWVYSAEELNL